MLVAVVVVDGSEERTDGGCWFGGERSEVGNMCKVYANAR
jgi:hypothetical protein